MRTHGSSCRRRASSSPRRVSSFSALSSSSRAASHSSRVPVMCFVIALVSFLLGQMGCKFLRDALPTSCVAYYSLFIRQPLVCEHEFRFLALGVELHCNQGCFSTSR